LSSLINGNAIISSEAVTAQATLSSFASIASDGVETAGSNVKHVELSSTVALIAYEQTAGTIGVKLGQKDGNACIVWDTNPTVLSGSWTLQDFVILDATHGLLILRDTLGGTIQTAVVTLTGATIAISAAVNSSITAVTLSIKATLINTNKVIIAYKNTSDSYPKAVVCTITGTTPSYGTPVAAKSAACTNATSISICKLTTTTFLMTYDNGTNSYGHILSFDGNTTITINTESIIIASLYQYFACAILDSTHVVVAFTDAGSSQATAIIGVISGTAISSWGSRVAFYSGGTVYSTHILILSSVRFAVVHTDGVDNALQCRVGTVTSGTTITFGTQYYSGLFIGGGSKVPLSVKLIDTNHISFSFYDLVDTSRRVYYSTITIQGVNTVVFNEMTVKLLTMPSNGQAEISLLLAKFKFTGQSDYIHFYIGGNEVTNNSLEMEQKTSSSAADAEYPRGILKLPNCPLVVPYGQSLYVGCSIAVNARNCTINISGVKSLTAEGGYNGYINGF
jgi:hypothetical protein